MVGYKYFLVFDEAAKYIIHLSISTSITFYEWLLATISCIIITVRILTYCLLFTFLILVHNLYLNTAESFKYMQGILSIFKAISGIICLHINTIAR